jgi:hypothetical protein
MVSALYCVLSLLCFMSFGPLRFPSQVQPFAAIVAWAGVLYASKQGYRLHLNRLTVVLACLSILFLFYLPEFPPIGFDFLRHAKKSMAFLFSIGIVLYAPLVTREVLQRSCIFASCVWGSVALIQYTIPPLYVLIAKVFCPDKNLEANLSERGATSLSPEATDFGFTAAFILLFSLLSDPGQPGDRLQKRTILSVALALGCVLLSKSGSGVIAAAVILVVYFLPFFLNPRLVGAAILAGVLCIVGTITVLAVVPMSTLMEFRGINLLVTIVTSPTDLMQTSFSHRVIHNAIGYRALEKTNGLGYGAGTFTEIAPAIYINEGYNTNPYLSEFHVKAVEESLEENPVGIIPILLFEYGIFGVAFLLVAVSKVFFSNLRLRFACTLLVFTTLYQSFPPAYPPLWLLIGLVDNPRFQSRSSEQHLEDE